MIDQSCRPIVQSKCRYRHAGDDFFCIRYQVWYRSLDCAIRTTFKTSSGCLSCDQGLFNAKRHSVKLRSLRIPLHTNL